MTPADRLAQIRATQSLGVPLELSDRAWRSRVVCGWHDIDYLLARVEALETALTTCPKCGHHLTGDFSKVDWYCEGCGRSYYGEDVPYPLEQPHLVIHHGPNENPLMIHTCSCGRYECPDWKERDEVHG